MEIALVLDVTGSMAGAPMTALRNAATDLVNIIYGPNDTLPNLWVSVVPYTSTVNIGRGRSGWLAAGSLNASSYGNTVWRGCVITAAACCLVVVGAKCDLSGYARRIPDTAQVKSVRIICNGYNSTLTEAENIQAVEDIHRAVVAEREKITDDTSITSLQLTYKLTNGKVLMREYTLPDTSTEQCTFSGIVTKLGGPEAEKGGTLKFQATISVDGEPVWA